MNAITSSPSFEPILVDAEDPYEINRQIDRYNKNGWKDFDADLKAFSYYYLEHYNHRKAAQAIGRPAGSGISLIRNPLVSAFIGYLQEKRNITNIITADFVRSQYLDLIPKLAGEVPIPMVNSDGDEYMVHKFHSNELISVLKELGKSTKFYENGSGQGGGQVQVSLNFGGVMSEGERPEIVIETQEWDDGR